MLENVTPVAASISHAPKSVRLDGRHHLGGEHGAGAGPVHRKELLAHAFGEGLR
jgi:hypothetical protein